MINYIEELNFNDFQLVEYHLLTLKKIVCEISVMLVYFLKLCHDFHHLTKFVQTDVKVYSMICAEKNYGFLSIDVYKLQTFKVCS